jgi:tetratricopeptide (TPR) repeat protein
MRQSAATAQEWLALVQWCKTKKRWREAFDFASKAYKLFPNDEGVQLAMLDAYERDGWDAEALVLHRLRLERNPSAQHYLATLAAATRAGQDRGLYRQSLLDWAQRKEPTTERLYGPAGGTVSYLDVSVRVRWYVEAEQDAQAALGLLQLPGTRCDARLLLALARQLPRTHDEAAREIFVRLLDEDMEGAVTPYAQALSLVQQALERMTTAQRAQWLSSLRTQYKAKRNFIKELPLA